ncbi:glycoside hydrolase family 47 protein [Backusella circina FSU 941]|nr:glycoside hydrolase family 47 protein [Backusella circina FSU 941]
MRKSTCLIASCLFFTFINANQQPERQNAIKDAFLHAWNGYKRYAYGHDELKPVSNTPSDSRNGWAASIYDGLDTLLIMNLQDEYDTAINYIKRVDWKNTTSSSKTFETTIRYLGGLLAANDLQPNKLLVDQAVALAKYVIMPAFDTPNGVPTAYVDARSSKPIMSNQLTLAEFGSLQLELTRLSQVTGDSSYEKIGNKVIEKISQVPSLIPGLYPTEWDLEHFLPRMADSFYEYLLKTPILMNGNDLQLDMWKTSIESMRKYLSSETESGKIFLAEFNRNYKLLQSGELICFIPGNILLGSKYLKDSTYEAFSHDLMSSCYDTWANTPTGISPETWSWVDKSQNLTLYPEEMQKRVLEDGFIVQDSAYDLRPETIESLFYFYRLTGDSKYQDMGWKLFEAIEKHCKTDSGFTRIGNVANSNDVKPLDFQESYFFAETLKYLYLLFSDPNTISLNEYVLNTEAHPFKLETPINVQAETFF